MAWHLKNIMIPIFVLLGLIALIETLSYFILLKKYNRSIPDETIENGRFGNSNGLKSNLNTKIWGEAFSTDDKGSRPAKAYNKKPKKVWIGDSVVEGVGVSDSLIFTYLLAESDSVYDYLNFAHAGNTPIDYFNTINSLIDTNSILVNDSVHSFHIGICLNDINPKEKIQSTLPAFIQKANLLLQISNTYRLLKLWINRNSDGYFQYDAAMYKDQAKVHEVIDQLVRISALCKSKNISCQFYIFPYKSQLVSGNFSPQQTLAYHMGINGLPFIDLSSYLRKGDNLHELYLFSDEIHFSAKGHKAIATSISMIR